MVTMLLADFGMAPLEFWFGVDYMHVFMDRRFFKEGYRTTDC